jgi:hypothetical protein
MDIIKKHYTEIYKDEQHGHISVLCFLVMSMLLIFIYFCVMFFGDVHVLIFIYFCVMFFGDVHVAHLKMTNMDITKKHSTEIYKDENMDITKKHNTEIYKDEQHGHHQKT